MTSLCSVTGMMVMMLRIAGNHPQMAVNDHSDFQVRGTMDLNMATSKCSFFWENGAKQRDYVTPEIPCTTGDTG